MRDFLTVIVVAGLLLMGLLVAMSNVQECRSHGFSWLYCLTAGAS